MIILFGFLRETSELVVKAGVDLDTGIIRTGLNEYLNVIFPNIKDWIHDKCFGSGFDKSISRKRPDYRSEYLKLIVEFDGLPHYQNPEQIKTDLYNKSLYESFGYKVVRIPYFIQLSNEVVKTLFDVEVPIDLFDDKLPSLTINSKATPAFLCLEGIKRMAKEFKLISPSQYLTNLEYLKRIPKEESYRNGWEILDYFYNQN